MQGIQSPKTFHSMMLVAVPQLADPNFFKKVVLILHHDPQGAFGLVLNDPTDYSLVQFSEEQNLKCHETLASQPVYSGGPVDTHRGWVLHASQEIQEKQELIDGLYVSGTQEALEYFFSGAPEPFRFLLGYAGWAPGQLEKEMQEGSWLALPLETKYVFTENTDAIWPNIFKDLKIDPYQLAQGGGFH